MKTGDPKKTLLGLHPRTQNSPECPDHMLKFIYFM